MSIEMNFYYAVMLLLTSAFQHVNQMFMEIFYQEWGPELCFLLLIYEFYFENICKKFFELIRYICLFSHSSFEGTRLTFNVIIYSTAAKRLPEFCGLKGNKTDAKNCC